MISRKSTSRKKYKDRMWTGYADELRGPVRPSPSAGRLFYTDHGVLTFPSRTETEWRRQTPVSAPTEAEAAVDEGGDQWDSSNPCSSEGNGHARGTNEPERPASSHNIGSGRYSGHTATAWVGVMHGVIVGALEFVLTLTNAVDQNAFASHAAGVRDVIFGGSTIMEGAGMLFAIVLAYQNWTRFDGPISVGVPAIVAVEGLFVMESDESVLNSAVCGVFVQTLAFLTYVVAVKVTDKVARIILICTVFVAPCFLFCAFASSNRIRKCSGSKCWTFERSILVLIVLFWFTVPFIVELWENMLHFTSGSASLSSYTLPCCPGPCNHRSGNLLCSRHSRVSGSFDDGTGH